jgi:cobalt-zinc-cadmium efflux system outer membrane protein
MLLSAFSWVAESIMPTMNKGGQAPMKTIPMLLAGLAIVWPAYAQSLGEALEQAWTRHPQAAAVSAREDEARARADVAAGITPGPASMSLSSLNDRLNKNRGKQEWEVEMAVPLWLPGQQAARAAEAESAVMEVAARRAALRLQIAGEVREAWWTVAAARNARDLARRRATTAGALEADVRRRFTGRRAGADRRQPGARRAYSPRSAEAGRSREAALLQAEQALRNADGYAAAPLRGGAKRHRRRLRLRSSRNPGYARSAPVARRCRRRSAHVPAPR